MSRLIDKIKDSISKKKICINPIYELENSYIDRLLENAICFHGNSANNYLGMEAGRYCTKVPYPVVWVEFDNQWEDKEVSKFGVFLQERGKWLRGSVFVESAGRAFLFHVWEIMENGDSLDFRMLPNYGEVAESGCKESMQENATLCAIFLSAINCTNVRRVEHKPSRLKQQMRARHGKPPLFSYWTLELDLTRPESHESLGGTHASPRVHLRRGHARQYAPGKWCWVQRCTVGDKAKGMVHKDYAVRRAAA